MPPTIPRHREQLIASLARTVNLAAALATQQQLDISDSSGQVGLRTGVLGQYPTSGDTFTSGWGLEVLSDGTGSAPVLRAGILDYSNGGSEGSLIGLVLCKADGSFQTLWDASGDTAFLQASENLSDVASPSTALASLGIAVGTCSIAHSASASGSVAVTGLPFTPSKVIATARAAQINSLDQLYADTYVPGGFTLHDVWSASGTFTVAYSYLASV